MKILKIYRSSFAKLEVKNSKIKIKRRSRKTIIFEFLHENYQKLKIFLKQ